MYKSIIILYFVCFCLYVLFSRQPDYFDGEFTKATVHFAKGSTGSLSAEIYFKISGDSFSAHAGYLFRNLNEGETVDIIYDTSKPSNVALYRVWGYWIKWSELLGSIILLFALFQIALAVNKNPTPEAIIEQMEYKPQKKKKYED